MANGITLQSVIGFAYGIPARNISGGPDWIRLSGPTSLDDDSFTLRQAETFFIEAVAESPATATTEELKEMLGTMLEDRFGLKFHRETRQAKGYALVVAKDGPKIQEVSSGYESPRATFDETLRRSIKGTSKLNELIDILLPPAFEPFVDRTGLTGTYRYEFLAPLPPPPAPPSPRRDATAGPGAAERLGEIPPPSSAIPTLSGSLEAQLGLRLQPDTVAVEMLVIDHVERPSSN